MNNGNLHDDPNFEDSLKNFVTSRLAEEDLDKIGDDRMLKIVLLDQLMVEYLMNIQQDLLVQTTNLANRNQSVQGKKDELLWELEAQKRKIDDLRSEKTLISEKAMQAKLYRQQMNSYKCPYCNKIFKNLHFLEAHMVRHEAHNLKLEREGAMRKEKAQAEQDKIKEEQLGLERKAVQLKEQEMQRLQKDIDELKAQLSNTNNSKNLEEEKLKRVNDELRETLQKMENDLKLQNKNVDKLKNEVEVQKELLSRPQTAADKKGSEQGNLAAPGQTELAKAVEIEPPKLSVVSVSPIEIKASRESVHSRQTKESSPPKASDSQTPFGNIGHGGIQNEVFESQAIEMVGGIPKKIQGGVASQNVFKDRPIDKQGSAFNESTQLNSTAVAQNLIDSKFKEKQAELTRQIQELSKTRDQILKNRGTVE
jgi:hypothetical protein